MDRDREPDTMEMTVMIFGAACSPSAAQYIKNANAKEFEEEFPKAVNAIVKKHYVDDYLDGRKDDDDAIKLIKEVIEIQKKGGFVICNWLCNSPKVVEQIPVELRATGPKELIPHSEMMVERVLGIHWDIEDDDFKFKLKFHNIEKDVLTGVRRPTKCEVFKSSCLFMILWGSWLISSLKQRYSCRTYGEHK